MRHKKLKILMYIPTLKGGGAERVFVSLANYFSNRNVDVILYTYNSGTYSTNLRKEVEYICDDRKNVFHKRAFYTLFNLFKIIRTRKPDVLFTTLDEANALGYLTLKLFKRDIKFITRQANILAYEDIRNKKIKDKIFNYLNKKSFKYSDLIIANSQDTLLSIKEIYGIKRKLIFIPNPISVNHEINEKRESYRFDPLKTYILSVGRLTEVKDYYTALKSFKEVLRNNNNFHFIILGEGPLKENLMILIQEFSLQEHVSLLGFVKNPYFFYKNSNLFLHCSKSEGFGNVIVEALAFGLPIVCTKCSGGPRYILEEGKYGSLVNVGNYREISNKILYELSNDSSYKKNMRIARYNYFSLDNIGEMYLFEINNC